MKCGVVKHWRDLGVQLLKPKYEHYLDEIEADHPNNNRKCCTTMFGKWLETTYDACWDQLHEALIEIDLETAAAKVKKFYEGTYIATYLHTYHT